MTDVPIRDSHMKTMKHRRAPCDGESRDYSYAAEIQETPKMARLISTILSFWFL